MYEYDIKRFLDRHHYQHLVPRAALIDMDGTLYDSMPNHAKAWHRMVSELGIESDPQNYYLWEGRTGRSVINELFEKTYGHTASDEEINEYYGRKTQYFSEMSAPSVMPGAPEMLKVLCDTGIKRVLVTGSGQASLIDRLNRDFPGVFQPDMMVTAMNVKHGKPHPEPFLRGMQLARVSPSQAIAVDNAPLGVESADRAGAFAVGVVTGPIPAQALWDAGAAVVFNSMSDFAACLPMLLLEMLKTNLI